MALKIDSRLTVQKIHPKVQRLFELSAEKIRGIEKHWEPAKGTPVFTVKGRYTSRGWTEWTQGFQFGSALLQYDATGEEAFLEIGRSKTVAWMASHVSHVGVHDHGFNNISTYGNLLRLMREGKIPANESEKNFYELALKVSGAVQAARWTEIADGTGFIHSFNGPHSLFIDTMRSLRSLAVAHRLGHVLMGERDRKISLLRRLLEHAAVTARFNVFYGEGRDAFDVPGRTAHETIFNLNDGHYRCPNSQQGYSPFTTWTRGLAWAILGFAEQLEFLDTLPNDEFEAVCDSATSSRHTPSPKKLRQSKDETANPLTNAESVRSTLLRAAMATADFYIENSCTDGIPMWDTGAPHLYRLGDYLDGPADPFNPWEPVDSSAAAIAAQGLLRLGQYLAGRGKPRSDPRKPRDLEPEPSPGASASLPANAPPAEMPALPGSDSGRRKLSARYRQTGLTVANTLLSEPYLSTNRKHQGLLLHSVYHRPNGWDYVAPGQKIPNGESSMWGDYHLLELALLLRREARGDAYLTFFGCVNP